MQNESQAINQIAKTEVDRIAVKYGLSKQDLIDLISVMYQTSLDCVLLCDTDTYEMQV